MNQPNSLTKEDIRKAVRDFYGRVAQSGGDVQTITGCCGPSAQSSLKLGYSPGDLAAAPEGSNMGLGCGNPQAIASLGPGETVLDLGSGGGFDCFLAAKQVGSAGMVIGVDMTPEMIAKARANAAKAGVSNVEFRLGEIEHLPVEDESVDVILSNCVINLSPDKEKVFREAFRALKPGGRLAISDVVATGQLPPEAMQEIAALTGCAGGAGDVSTLRRLLENAGFEKIRITPRPESREFIREWMPGLGVEDYVASASIEAVKPGAGSCCATSCCGGKDLA
ncbi:MAG: Arsenite methyltransferase [Myxococcota bacterium]|nr:Arsenite methyltransferase [Myxococcota bacterium]